MFKNSLILKHLMWPVGKTFVKLNCVCVCVYIYYKTEQNIGFDKIYTTIF